MTTATVRILDVPLGPGRRTLRLALLEGGTLGASQIELALGFGGADTGDPFERPGWAERPVGIPASSVGPICSALNQIIEGIPEDDEEADR